MPREGLYSPFPSRSLPQRIASLAMSGGLAPDAEVRRSPEKRPPRLVEVPELLALPGRRSLDRHATAALRRGAACQGNKQAPTREAALRQSADDKGRVIDRVHFRIIRACCSRTTSRKADHHLARRGPHHRPHMRSVSAKENNAQSGHHLNRHRHAADRARAKPDQILTHGGSGPMPPQAVEVDASVPHRISLSQRSVVPLGRRPDCCQLTTVRTNGTGWRRHGRVGGGAAGP